MSEDLNKISEEGFVARLNKFWFSSKFRLFKDRMALRVMFVLTILSIALAALMGWGLYYKSSLILEEFSLWELISSSNWKPEKGEFGFFAFIMGTLWVTGIAISIALPMCLLASIFLSEYAPGWIKKMIIPVVDLLAGIPPVVFGVWGVLMIVPFIGNFLSPEEYNGIGFSVLAGGIVLAVMIFPLMVSLFLEVFSTVPKDMKNASLSLGATQWQTVKFVLLKKSLPGLIATTVLAVSRAFGETIAVLLVCGNAIAVPHSVYDKGYPLPALLANNFGEIMSDPLQESALLFSAFLLFVIIFVFNAISRIVLNRVKKNID